MSLLSVIRGSVRYILLSPHIFLGDRAKHHNRFAPLSSLLLIKFGKPSMQIIIIVEAGVCVCVRILWVHIYGSSDKVMMRTLRMHIVQKVRYGVAGDHYAWYKDRSFSGIAFLAVRG